MNSVDRNGTDHKNKRIFNDYDDEWNEEFDRGKVKKKFCYFEDFEDFFVQGEKNKIRPKL